MPQLSVRYRCVSPKNGVAGVDIKQQAARGVLWSAVGTWGQQLGTFLVFAILARLLSPAAFGLVALATVFTAFTKILAEQGLVDAVVQRPQIDARDLDTAFWANLAVSVLFAGILAAVSPAVAAALEQPRLGPVLAALSFGIVFAGFSGVQRAILTRDLAFSSLTLRTLIAVTVGAVAGVTAAVLGAGVWSLVVLNLSTEAAGAVTLWAVSDWRPGFRFSFVRLRSLTSFGLNIVGFKILNFLNRRSDDLLIGYYLGAVPLGYYTIAKKLVLVMLTVTTHIVGTVAFPVFSKIQGDADAIRRGYYKAIRLTSILAFPAFIGLAAAAPELIGLLFGAKWAPSVPVMRIFAITGLIQSVLFVPGIGMKALGKPSWRLAITTLITAANLIVFFVTVQWGIVAVAAGFALVNLALAPLTLAAARRLIGSDARTTALQILPAFVASMVMGAVVLGLGYLLEDLRLVVRVVIMVGVGMGVYLLVLRVIAQRLISEAVEVARLALRRTSAS